MKVSIIFFVLIFIAARRLQLRRKKVWLKDTSISPEALQKVSQVAGRVVILDLRDAKHVSDLIPGSIRIPLQNLADNPFRLSTDIFTILYGDGKDDGRIQAIMERIRELQLTRVRHLDGGMEAWRSLGYPTLKQVEHHSEDIAREIRRDNGHASRRSDGWALSQLVGGAIAPDK